MCTSLPSACRASRSSWAKALESADGASAELVVLVVGVAVAVLEVLAPGVVARVLRSVELSTSPCRRLAPISGVTAPDRVALVCRAVVSVVRLAVGPAGVQAPSGSTRFIKRTGMAALAVMRQALRRWCRTGRACSPVALPTVWRWLGWCHRWPGRRCSGPGRI